MRASVASSFRDIDDAESLWQEADKLAPGRAWLWTVRASLLVKADCHLEALDAAREALRLQPWYRPAVQEIGPILALLGRDDEAVALLEDALDPCKGGLQSPGIAAQLVEVYRELHKPAEMLRCLERFESLAPLIEEPGRSWVISRRCEARLQMGDLPGAAASAESVAIASPFYARTAERLRQPERANERRVHLEVPFVRQHEKTCAPATLAAISQFWNRPVDHAAIAREICYGGTFDHQERYWAETHGWVAREFRADWHGSIALLNAGIPFALTTAWINSGHLQAVIGYDARRGTLLIRDPSEHNHRELLADEFFNRYAFYGPRAMALAPADDPGAAARLREAVLAEANLYDTLYRLRRALHDHDRDTAGHALAAMETEHREARLTLLAQREVAFYDGNDPRALAAVEGLLALYPAEGRLWLEKLRVLRRLAQPGEARDWLEKCAADPAHTEPNVWRELARELFPDARLWPRARQLLARALFFEPTEPEHLRALAELRWNEGRYSESATLTRFAACAAMTREDLWQHFFVASRHVRETEQAFGLLEARYRRLGDQSSHPARTLVWAHRERHEHAQASAILAEALNRRPDDGDLLVFAAAAEARIGEHEKAALLLVSATGRVDPGTLARAAAELASLQGNLGDALTHWKSVLSREPLDLAAHSSIARLLAETDSRGPAAARAYLNSVVKCYPRSVVLHSLRVQWLVEDPGRGSAEHMAAVDELLAVQAANAWALREKALGHEIGGKFEGAFAALEEAERLDPLAAPTHAIRGRLYLAAGNLTAACVSLRRALELDVGSAGALYSLLEASLTAAEKRASLDFVRGELLRQPVADDALLAYRVAAYPIFEDAELQAQLDEVLAARPDLWQAWSAVSRQHADAGRIDKAREHAVQAAERFPLLPQAWMALAIVENLAGRAPEEIAALERALRLQADYGEASRQLARVHRRSGDFASARSVLERAIKAAPRDITNRGLLAETLWEEDQTRHGARVLEILVDIVQHEPGFDWAWETLDHHARLLGEVPRLEAAARQLAAARPDNARAWLRLARTLNGSDERANLEESLDALERALKLNPRLEEAHDLRARLLANAGLFDEALAACHPPPEAYTDQTRPFTLEGRAAWVIKQRGDLSAAREKLRAVVADHPGYEWGWRMLADWAGDAADWLDAQACAERLVCLSPHTAPPLSYLADARLRLGQRCGAKRALREAMRDPAYLFAPVTLIRVLIEGEEWAEAEEVLAFLERHHPGPVALSRKVMLALGRDEPGRARLAFAELARACPGMASESGCLKEGFKAMVAAGQRDEAEAALLQAIQRPGEVHPEAGAIWVRSRIGRCAWRGLAKAMRRMPEGEVSKRARLAYIAAMKDNHRDGSWWSKIAALARWF